MSYGGGEILRGVMERNSVFSEPAFYCVPLNGRDGTGNASLTTRGFLQLNKSYYFLVTSLLVTATTGVTFEQMNQPEFVRLFDPVDQNNFVLAPLDMQGSLIGDPSMNNPVVLPTYMLWEPGSLIGVEWLGVNHADTQFKFLTLAGIEYGMKGA